MQREKLRFRSAPEWDSVVIGANRKKDSSSHMSDSETGGRGKKASPEPAKAGERPDWATGLKKLYDSVVDEPLPDAFQELLAKLDDDEA
jgi:hypothetical protein